MNISIKSRICTICLYNVIIYSMISLSCLCIICSYVSHDMYKCISIIMTELKGPLGPMNNLTVENQLGLLVDDYLLIGHSIKYIINIGISIAFIMISVFICTCRYSKSHNGKYSIKIITGYDIV
jgi:hypothetical protein